MGADIHMVVERRVKVRDAEVWVGVNAFPYTKAMIYDWGARDADPPREVSVSGNVHYPATGRNYSLFAALAGVRGSGPAPLGVPDDASDLALMAIDGWGEDGHSHSWMLMSEALPLFIKLGQFGDPATAVLGAMKDGTVRTLDGYMEHFWQMDEDETLDTYRLIFWFDN